ncbi:MAG TPA: M17 family peptidase N-terminal domain-containing protein, partial [Smithellaceae bacterium]|nr:M17 family peptidase N-terminal domain-containing protein [Smithellaceae bacterium]
MKINVKKGAIDKTAADAIILTMFQEEKELPADVAAIDARCGGIIGEVIKNGDISGKPSQVSVVYIKGKVPAKRIVLVGLGKRNEINPEKIREA